MKSFSLWLFKIVLKITTLKYVLLKDIKIKEKIPSFNFTLFSNQTHTSRYCAKIYIVSNRNNDSSVTWISIAKMS